MFCSCSVAEIQSFGILDKICVIMIKGEEKQAPATGVPSSSRLEEFLILAKTARGAAAVDLIKRVTEAPGVYAFGELLDNPNIKEVSHFFFNLCTFLK
jgi:hypothetical protein